jgi:hypothetical protein
MTLSVEDYVGRRTGRKYSMPAAREHQPRPQPPWLRGPHGRVDLNAAFCAASPLGGLEERKSDQQEEGNGAETVGDDDSQLVVARQRWLMASDSLYFSRPFVNALFT